MSNVVQFKRRDYVRMTRAESEEQRVWRNYFREEISCADLTVAIRRADVHLAWFKAERAAMAVQAEVAAIFEARQ
jgi:hypothetical protein